MSASTLTETRPTHDLIVLSDLHLGEGCPGGTGRYAPREDFFSDEAFTRDLRKIADGKAVYANSGTWTAVNNPWDRLVPEARRHTFLYVQGNEARLCRWNDDAERIDRVPLFLFDEDRAREGCPDEGLMGPLGSRKRRRRRTTEAIDQR